MRTLFLFSLVTLLYSCSNRVPISGNTPPEITVIAYPSGSGNIEEQNTSGPRITNVDIGTKLVFAVTSKNPGGVKDLSVDISTNNTVLFQAATSSTPDASNKVPDQLEILGTNGAGGPGNTDMSVPNMIAPVVVKTSSSDYNAHTRSFQVTYVAVDPKQRGKDQTTRITLQKPFGNNYYIGTFPVTPVSGTVTGLANNGAQPVLLLRKGQTPSDCSTTTPASWLILGQGNNLFPNDIKAVFGDPASLPATIYACANPGAGSSPDQIVLDLTYHLN